MRFHDLQEMDQNHIAHTYARSPVGLVNGYGASCWDIEGNEYIDFTAGIGVNSLGFCDEQWVAAVQKQAATLPHVSNLYYTLPDTLLARKLCERAGCARVFFANSGAEANEGVIKAARKYSGDRYGAGREEIITLENSFHGRTVTTLSATGQDAMHTHFGPFTPGFSHVPANDFAALEAAAGPRTCAVMLELIQGEGGVVPLEPGYVKQVARLCEERDILLIVDEVQTGVGRTGTFLACEQFGVQPDLVSLAKGLGGGLPIGAVLLYEKCRDTLGPGDHGSTFGGNPIACAGGCAILDRLDAALLEQVRENGAYLAAELRKLPRVRSVSGLGLMLGAELDGIASKDLVARCLARGAIFLTAKAKLRLLPPLVITREQIDKGLAILRETLEHWEEQTE